MKSIPNILTVLRVVAAISFPWVPPQTWVWIIGFAIVSEFFDGYLARRMQATSRFGRMLDPIADKLFITAVLASYLWHDLISPWQVVAIAARDITVLIGLGHTFIKRKIDDYKAMEPSFLGKLTTAFQFAFIVTVGIFSDFPEVLFWIAATSSAASSIDYIRIYNGHCPLISWQIKHGEKR